MSAKLVSPKEIIIKNVGVLRGLMERNFHPLLIGIILDIAERYGLVMTESYREPRHKGDVHSTNPVRAIDLRYLCYSDLLAYKIANDINRKWQYDTRRKEMKVALIHKVEGGGIHFHIQTHHRTKLK